MKTSQWAALSAAVVVSCALTPSRASGQTNPSEPSGVMSASPSVVQTGTKPTLTWNILYPAKIGFPPPTGGGGGGGGNGGSSGSGGGNNGAQAMVWVDPPGTLVPSTTVYATVQVVGTGVTSCNAAQDAVPRVADARVSFNGGAYQQLFYGLPQDVVPSKNVYVKKMTAGQKLDFAGRYLINGAWSPLYTTYSSNFQVVTLANGQTPPTTFPLHQSSKLAGYMRPYLDSTGKVKIGPLSVLVMMELGQNNRSSPCFDCQDMVLLVTFGTKHPNNGHGNNLDGVDSSNPGNGRGGPNGMVDPSGGVDDERK